MAHAGSCPQLRRGWWWEMGVGVGPVPLRNEFNVLSPMVQQLTAESGWNFSQESTDKSVAPCRFQELIKALSEEETFSPTQWKDQWSRIRF